MELQQRFVDTVADVLGAHTEDDRFACEAVVAATGAMVTGRVAAGDAADLPALRAPIMRLVRRLRVAE
jgi:S-adenosylmethionine synthetase